jgi:hypothetical protein
LEVLAVAVDRYMVAHVLSRIRNRQCSITPPEELGSLLNLSRNLSLLSRNKRVPVQPQVTVLALAACPSPDGRGIQNSLYRSSERALRNLFANTARVWRSMA